MPAVSRLKYAYLAFLSKPKGERWLFRHIRKHRVRTILEIGVGDLGRAERLIQVAQRYAPGETVRYTGVDLFEAAGPGAGVLTLKEAHRRLSDIGSTVRLLPGDPGMTICRIANTLLDSDLVIFSAGQLDELGSDAWYFVPRMLSPKALVISEEAISDDEFRLMKIKRQEIDNRARAAAPRRAA